MRKVFCFVVLMAISVCLYSCSSNSSNSAKSDINWNGYAIDIIGSQDTDDNPWGYTAGEITDDTGNYILLTPNTSFMIDIAESDSLISLQTTIHPWVAESSDGAGVEVWMLDESGNILFQESITLDPDGSWYSIQYPSDLLQNATSIQFLCNNGTNDDDSCDWVIFKYSEDFLSDFGNGGYVKSATYYGNEWPINFWNSEFETVDEDFQQIKDDGFNSIIICIPWKEFQTSTQPIEYSEYAFLNLNRVMQAAERFDLDVYARVGYSWDFFNDTKEYIQDRYLGILRDPNVLRTAWLDYCRSIYATLSSYSVFQDGFLTWEDFWGCLDVCNFEDDALRINLATSIGYQDWVAQTYGLNEYNAVFECDFKTQSEIPIPQRKEPAMGAFFRFYDEYLNALLDDTQDVFPNMSMEVRLDADLVTNVDGEAYYYTHSDTFSCVDSDFTATMYGIPMGFENVGEQVGYNEAISHTDYILNNLSAQNKGKPIYVDQFLFADNTPQFSHNARIRNDEVGLYLENISSTLEKYTKGYGIWTYRDYKNNMLFNSQFALGERGWLLSNNISPRITYCEAHSSWDCHLNKGDTILQEIPIIRDHFPKEYYYLEFVIKESYDALLECSMGNDTKILPVPSSGLYEVMFTRNDSFDLSINVLEGSVAIDNLVLYSFVQEGYLYDKNNIEEPLVKSIRILNTELSLEN